LFRSRDELDGGGSGGLAARAAPVRPGWRTRIERRFHQLNIVHDLAEEIGSARWYRGFASMLGLGVAALAFWPDFSAVEAATAIPADARLQAELRSQAIAPLASGRTGRRRYAELPAGDRVVPIASVPERPRIELVATLGAGDGFDRMLRRAGVGPVDAARASEMVGAVMPLGDLKAGTRVAVTLGGRAAPGEPRSLEKLTFRARFDLDLVVGRQGGALTIARQPVAVDAMPLRVRGTVGASLYRSARAAGAPMKAIEQYLQTIAAHVSLDGDIAPTDQFDMIVAYRRSASGDSVVGSLLYAGLERDGKPRTQLVRWKEGRFVDAAAMERPQVMTAGLLSPVNGRMTSRFGARRHPILGYVRMHSGVDFGAPWGAPIVAVSDGVVSFAGRHGGHGNFVKLDHGGGLGTGYAHMSRIAVSTGSPVRAGQVIGYVGSTGLSTGPHLHYELYRNGRAVDPLSVSFTFRAAGLDKDELDAVKSRIARLTQVAPGAALQKLASPKSASIAAE
jgi:murein DD-endopeptidase MepM/ murein hydrolase activator NlpD